MRRRSRLPADHRVTAASYALRLGKDDLHVWFRLSRGLRAFSAAVRTLAGEVQRLPGGQRPPWCGGLHDLVMQSDDRLRRLGRGTRVLSAGRPFSHHRWPFNHF